MVNQHNKSLFAKGLRQISEGINTIADAVEIMTEQELQEYVSKVFVGTEYNLEEGSTVETLKGAGATTFKKATNLMDIVTNVEPNQAEEDENFYDEETVNDEELVNAGFSHIGVHLEDEEIEIDEDLDDIEFSVEELEGMSLGELTSIAKDMGLDTKNLKKKNQLIEAIISAQGSLEENEEEIEEQPIDELEKIKIELEKYSEEELADVLSSIGITPKGKKQALISKVLDAIQEGLLEWEDEEVEDEINNVEDVEEDVEVVDNDEDIEDEDEPPFDTDEEDVEEISEEQVFGTPKYRDRKLVLDSLEDEFKTAYKSKEITDSDINELLSHFYEKSEIKGMTKATKHENYLNILSRLIDDKGELNSLGDLYYVNDVPCCCATPLKKVDGTYICEVCGNEYEE